MSGRLTVFALVMMSLMVSLSSCDRSPERSDERSRPETTGAVPQTASYEGPEDLTGTEWSLDTLNGREAKDGSEITLDFPNKGELDGDAGCYVYFSLYSIKGDDLLFEDGGLEVGEIGCDASRAVREQADEYLRILRNLASVDATSERLELADSSGGVAVFVPPEPAEVDPALEGTEWVLTFLEGEDPARGTRITLEIGKEGLGGFSGCNGYGGGFETMASGRVRWSEDEDGAFMGTSMGCSPPKGPQESDYWRAMQGIASYRLAGDRLEMGDEKGRTMLVFRRKVDWNSDPAALIGTRWKLRSSDGRSPARGSVPTLSFESESRYGGYDGCRHLTGSYEATADDIVFTGSRMKELACMKPEALSETTAHLPTEAVGEAGDYRLVEGRLEIFTDEGTDYVFVPLRGDGSEGASVP